MVRGLGSEDAMAWLRARSTELAAGQFVAQNAEVFALFDRATQDSGNVSYGVRAGGARWFVKTAGTAADEPAALPHEARVALLRNAIRLARAVSDVALPALHNVIEASDGPLLVYEWAEGELLRVQRASRSDPSTAFVRFLGLPLRERLAALDTVFALHAKLAEKGYVASDFYDGCLIYDFSSRRLRVVDLDNYCDAPFTNRTGRLFGSTRFMAPEEYVLGARIDQRTTVFTLGRTAQQFLRAEGEYSEGVARLIARACEAIPELRFESVGEFYRAWSLVGRGERA